MVRAGGDGVRMHELHWEGEFLVVKLGKTGNQDSWVLISLPQATPSPSPHLG